ncbi:ROK family protein [Candidatus Woesearchaeota archaeon]|nr:ROK family protein [Candidatus Woesearchaeota archaeon]
MTFLGIDVGGQSIKAGIVTKKGELLEKEVCSTEPEKGREAVISNIEKVGRILLSKDKKIEAIGIGIPGIVSREGFVTLTPNIPLSNFDLGKELAEVFKKKTVFGNDADNFALAQKYFGQGKKFENIITLTLGTGVGSGVILNGELFSNNGAPEFGHTTIKFDGPPSKCCGSNGCVESFLGRKSFKDGGPLDVYKKALRNDKQALKIFEQYGKYLGIALSNFVNIFSPDIVILGGQLSNAFDFFKLSMEHEMKHRSLFKTKVVKNTMREPGTVGSATLAFE